MSKILCTFSGKFGDILWSLPTVKELARRHTELEDARVDFAVMPQYESLLPLLQAQRYIRKAFVIKEWICTGSPCGDQPWNSPEFPGREEYDEVIDLTYKEHPYGLQLADWIAKAAGVTFSNNLNPLPFLSVEPTRWSYENVIAYAFNEMYADQKSAFIEEVKLAFRGGDVGFIDAGKLPWLAAAQVLQDCTCFIGCRSANYVMAHGFKKRAVVFEPHPMRNGVFACSHGIETDVKAAGHAVAVIESWMQIDRSGK